MIKATEAAAITCRIAETELYKQAEEEISRKIEEAAIEGKNSIEAEVMVSHVTLLVKALISNGYNVQKMPSQRGSVVKLWIEWPII